MRVANNINVRVFCKEGENKELIIEKLKLMLPFDLEKEKIKVKETRAEGFNGKRIDVIEVALEKERHVNAFLEALKEKLGSEKETLLKQLDSRLDDELNFFMRLDKDMMLKDRFVLTDTGNCYHIRINIAAFPKRREKAAGILKEIFK